MRRGWKTWVVAIIATFACAPNLSAEGASARAIHHRHARLHHGYVRYAHGRYRERGRGFAELVGDPESGVGFYPLPLRYRIGAWRYHMRDWRPAWVKNPVLFAMVMDAMRYNYEFVTPVDSWKLGVYDPYEGWGTPYFPGFYGPAEGDEDVPAFPFGRPYSNW